MFGPIDRKEAERYIASVDEWVRLFHNGDETIAAQAYQIPMKSPEEKTATDTLGHEFFVAISEYDRAKVEHSNHDDLIELRYLYNTAHCVQIVVDKARALGLLQVNENIPRKFADCTEKKVELEKKLSQTHRKITQLENLVRLLGGDPNTASNTFSGDVEAGGDSDARR